MTSKPILTPLPADRFRRTPWKNGGGVTIDIADAYGEGVEPGSWQGMIWRLGRTAIVTPGPFSDLTGCERLQTVIVGQGLVLETPDGEIDLRRPHQVVRYDGGTPITSRLESGPVEVVNLIADRAICDIALAAVSTPGRFDLPAGLHIVYAPDAAISGFAGETEIAIDAGDAMRIDNTTTIALTVRSGVTIVATIRLKV